MPPPTTLIDTYRCPTASPTATAPPSPWASRSPRASGRGPRPWPGYAFLLINYIRGSRSNGSPASLSVCGNAHPHSNLPLCLHNNARCRPRATRSPSPSSSGATRPPPSAASSRRRSVRVVYVCIHAVRLLARRPTPHLTTHQTNRSTDPSTNTRTKTQNNHHTS